MSAVAVDSTTRRTPTDRASSTARSSSARPTPPPRSDSSTAVLVTSQVSSRGTAWRCPTVRPAGSTATPHAAEVDVALQELLGVLGLAEGPRDLAVGADVLLDGDVHVSLVPGPG